jgi:hypothetical protein
VAEGSPAPAQGPAAGGTAGDGVDVEAVVDGGLLTLPSERRAGRTRVVFTARR